MIFSSFHLHKNEMDLYPLECRYVHLSVLTGLVNLPDRSRSKICDQNGLTVSQNIYFKSPCQKYSINAMSRKKSRPCKLFISVEHRSPSIVVEWKQVASVQWSTRTLILLTSYLFSKCYEGLYNLGRTC